MLLSKIHSLFRVVQLHFILQSAIPQLLLIVLVLMPLSLSSGASPIRAENNAQKPHFIYFITPTTLKRLDLDTGIAEPIFDYATQWTSTSAIAWASIEFSNNAHYIAYTRTDGSNWWLGISSLPIWQAIEIPIVVPAYSGTHLTWLPSDNYLLLSYSRFSETGEQVIKRQLLSLDSMEIAPFPYLLDAVGMTKANTLSLQWILDDNLQDKDNISPFPHYASFDLQDTSISYSQTPIPNPIRLSELLELNWDWSSQYGFIFYDKGEHELTSGYYWLSIDSPHIHPFMLTTAWHQSIQWALDTPYVLVRDHANTWYLYDAEQTIVISTLRDIPLHSGLTWLYAAQDLIYFDNEPIGHSNIYLVSLAQESRLLYTETEEIYDLAVSR